MDKKLFFVVNVDWFFLSHRLPLALHALKNGYKVYLLTADTGKKSEIEKLGIKVIEVPFERSGSDLKHELKCILLLRKHFKQHKPDIIHQVTLKASILGSFAAKSVGVKNLINAISGFGYSYTDNRKGILQLVTKTALSFAFKSNDFHYILQNPDDVAQLEHMNLIPPSHIHLIKGSGIDLNQFAFSEIQPKDQLIYLFPARILIDKGVIEFIQAAKMLKDKLYGKAKFLLAGDIDVENKSVMTEYELKELLEDNYIEWIGFQKDLYIIYQKTDVVVLPSYREGLPKSLIEACAVGRPIITTDVPGCRECVVNDYNGYLIPAKNVEMLAEKILILFENKEKRNSFGRNARILAEDKFSIETVIDKTFDIYSMMLE